MSTLGLTADGSVQVPSDIVQVGWFRLGPTPGQLGSAVILGHVDNYTGPGVFFQLRTLAAGDEVDVDLADGITARFVVNTVVMYSKSQFPADRVYASHGSSALQLVTCGGTFDHQTGHYLSNVVVYTSLVAVVPAAEADGGRVHRPGLIRGHRFPTAPACPRPAMASTVARAQPGHTFRRSFDAHSTFDAFDLRSLAAGLKRCSAPCGVMPPTASPISRQLAPCRRADSAEAWPSRSADRRRRSA